MVFHADTPVLSPIICLTKRGNYILRIWDIQSGMNSNIQTKFQLKQGIRANLFQYIQKQKLDKMLHILTVILLYILDYEGIMVPLCIVSFIPRFHGSSGLSYIINISYLFCVGKNHIWYHT